MTRALIILALVFAACLLGLWLVDLRNNPPVATPTENQPPPTTTPPQTESETASVETYVRANISQLSPEPEVLGGTFYVTEIDVRDDGTGTVHYEDGHIALVAEFTYRVDALGQPYIESFTVRE